MKKYRSIATMLLALSSGAALAADLPSRKGPPPAYLPPPPAFSWNGLYGGVNIGYGFGNGDNGSGAYYAPAPVIVVAVPPPATLLGFNTGNDLNGVVGGGQIGYNWQFSSWLVLGLEADIQAADLRSHGATYSAPFVNTTKSVDWFGTVRARVGLTPFMPNLLIYGTGGFAYGQVNQYVNVFDGAGAFGSASFDDTKTGWTAGGGVEWSPASFPAWSLKIEYLYTDLGSTNLAGYSIAPAGAFVFSHSSETRFHTVRAGLNWHFNPFAPAPVLAKY